MTVAVTHILAKLPVQTPSAGSAAATDSSVTGTDFARLLLGQLAADAGLQQSISGNAPALAATDLLDAKALDTKILDTKALDTRILDTRALDSNITDPAANPQDAAMLLAGLGITLPQQDRKIATDGIAANEVTADVLLVSNGKKESAILALDTRAHAEAGRPEAALVAETKAQTGLPIPLETGEKAAKFAVPDFAEPKTDALTVHSLPNEANNSTALAATPPPNAGAPVHNTTLKVETPLHAPSWSGDFAQKVVWLTSNDQKFAQLTLNPPQMGPIEISLNINKDTASAYFVSPNSEVREAIETALPRLREMLAGVGIELGQTNVSAQSSRQDTGNPDARQSTPRWVADEAILAGGSGRNQATIAQRGNSLVDTFA